MTCATARLERDLSIANTNSYTFAAKVVRGAYIVGESERAAELGLPHPLFTDKRDTDASYNGALTTMIEQIASNSSAAALVVATHNTESVLHAAAELKVNGVPPNHPNVAFGQIMGMCDHLALALGTSNYNANKLVLYGDFDEVFPWLLRRLDENRDMFGAAQQSRTLLVGEAGRRLRAWTGNVRCAQPLPLNPLPSPLPPQNKKRRDMRPQPNLYCMRAEVTEAHPLSTPSMLSLAMVM